MRLVETSEPLLRAAWDCRRADDDVLILGDLRRPEVADSAIQVWGEKVVAQAQARRDGSRPMLAYVQPASFATIMSRSDHFPHRGAGKELLAFAAMPGLVPLLVIVPDGLWATSWASPSSNAVVLRYEPPPDPARN